MPLIELHLPGTPNEHSELLGRNYSLLAHTRGLDRALGPPTALSRPSAEALTERQLAIEEARLAPTVAFTDFHTYSRVRELEFRRAAMQAERVWRNDREPAALRDTMLLDYQFANHRQTQYRAMAEMVEEQRQFLNQYLLQLQTLMPLLPDAQRRTMMSRQREITAYLYALNRQVERTTRVGSYLHISHRILYIAGERGFLSKVRTKALDMMQFQIAGDPAERDRARNEILEIVAKLPTAEQADARTALSTLLAAVPGAVPEANREARLRELQAPGGALHTFNTFVDGVRNRLVGERDAEGRMTTLGSLTRSRLDTFLLLHHLHQPRLTKLQRIEAQLTTRPAPAATVISELYFQLRPHAQNAPADAQLMTQTLAEVRAQIRQQTAVVESVQQVRTRRGNTAARNTPENQRLQTDAELRLNDLLSKLMGDGLVRSGPEEQHPDVFEADLGEQEHRMGQTLHNMSDRPLGIEPGTESRPVLDGKTVTPGMVLYFSLADDKPLRAADRDLAVRAADRREEGPSLTAGDIEYTRLGNGQLRVRILPSAVAGSRTLEYGPPASRIRVQFTVSRTEESDIGIERVPPGVLPQYLLIDAIQARYVQLLDLQTQTLQQQREGRIDQTQAAQIVQGLSKRREEMMRLQLQVMGRLGLYQERMAELFTFQNAFGQGRRMTGLIAGLPYDQLNTAPPPQPPEESQRIRDRRAAMARVMNVQQQFHVERMQLFTGSIRETVEIDDRARRDHRWLNDELPVVRRTANAAAMIITSPLALPGMIPGVGRITDPMRDALIRNIGDQVHRALETGPDGHPLPDAEKERRRQSLADLMNSVDRTKLTKLDATANALKGIDANLLRGARLTEAQVREAANNTARVPAPGDAETLRLITAPGPGRPLTEEEKTRGAILMLKLLKQFKEDVGDMENPNERKGVLGEYAWFLLETERILNIRLEVRSLLYEMGNKWFGVMRGMIIGAAAAVGGPIVLGVLGAVGGSLIIRPAARLAWWGIRGGQQAFFRGGSALFRGEYALAGSEAAAGAFNAASTGFSAYMAFNAWQRQYEASQRMERSRVEIENALRALGCTKDEANEKWVYHDRDNDIRAEIPFALLEGCLEPMQSESSILFREALWATAAAGGQVALNIAVARMRERAVKLAMEQAARAGTTITRRMALQQAGRLTRLGVRGIPVIGIIINVVLIGISIAAKRRKMRAIRRFMNGLPPALLAEVSWEGITGADLYTFLCENSDPPSSDEETPAQQREARERAIFVNFEGVLRDKQPMVLAEILAGMGNRFELAEFYESEFKPVFLPIYYLVLHRMCRATPAFSHHTWEAISRGEVVNGSHRIPKEMLERAIESAAQIYLHLHVYEKQYREVAHARATYTGNDPEVRSSLEEMERILGTRRVMGAAMNPEIVRELAALDAAPGTPARPAGLPDAFVRSITDAPELTPTSSPARLREVNDAYQRAFESLPEDKRQAGLQYLENVARIRGYRVRHRVREGGAGTILLLPVFVTRMSRISKLIMERGPGGTVRANEIPGVTAELNFSNLNTFATWAAESMEDPVERVRLRRELAQENMGSARWDSAYAANTLFWDVLNPEPIKRNAFYVGGFSGYAVRMPSRGPLPPELGAAAEWTAQHIFGADRLDPRSHIVFQTTAGDREAFARSSLSENANWLFSTRYHGRSIGRSTEMEERFFGPESPNRPTVLASDLRLAADGKPDFNEIQRTMLRNATSQDPSFSMANLESVVMESHVYQARKRIMRGMMVVHPLERISPRHTLTETNFLYRTTYVFRVNGQRHFVTTSSLSFQTPDGICEDDFRDRMGSSVSDWVNNRDRPYRTVYDGAFAFNEQTFTESSGGGYAQWLTGNIDLQRRHRITNEVAREADAFDYSGNRFRRAQEMETELGPDGPVVFLGIPAYMGDILSPEMHTLATRLLRLPHPQNPRLRTDSNPVAICIEFPSPRSAIATYILPQTEEVEGFPGDGRFPVRRRAIRLTEDGRLDEGADITSHLGTAAGETLSLLRLFRTNERDTDPANARDVLLRINSERRERSTPLVRSFEAPLPESVVTAARHLAARLRLGHIHAAELNALNRAITTEASGGEGNADVRRRQLQLSVVMRLNHHTVLPNHQLVVRDGAITVRNGGSPELLQDTQSGAFGVVLDRDYGFERFGVLIPGTTETVSRRVNIGGQPSALIVPVEGGDRVIIRREHRTDITVTVSNIATLMQRDDLTFIDKRQILRVLLLPRQGETRRQQLERIIAYFPFERRAERSAADALRDAVLPLINAAGALPEGRRRAPDPQLLIGELVDRLVEQRYITLAGVERIARPFQHEGADGRSPALVLPPGAEGSALHLSDGKRIDIVPLYQGRFAERLLDESVLERGTTLKLHAPAAMRFGDTAAAMNTIDVGASRTFCGNRFTITRLDPQTVEFTVAFDAAEGSVDLHAELPGQRLVPLLRHAGASIISLSVGKPPLISMAHNNSMLAGSDRGFTRPANRLYTPVRPGQTRLMSAPRGTSIDGQLMDELGTEKRIECTTGEGDARRRFTAIFRREQNDVISLRVEGNAFGASGTVIQLRMPDTPRGRHIPLRLVVAHPAVHHAFGLSSALPEGVEQRTVDGAAGLRINGVDYRIVHAPASEVEAAATPNLWHNVTDDNDDREYVLDTGRSRVFLRTGQPYTSRYGPFIEYDDNGGARFGRDIVLREVTEGGVVRMSYMFKSILDVRASAGETDLTRTLRERAIELLCLPPARASAHEFAEAVTRIFDLALFFDASTNTSSTLSRRAAFVSRMTQCMLAAPANRKGEFLRRLLTLILETANEKGVLSSSQLLRVEATMEQEFPPPITEGNGTDVAVRINSNLPQIVYYRGSHVLLTGIPADYQVRMVIPTCSSDRSYSSEMLPLTVTAGMKIPLGEAPDGTANRITGMRAEGALLIYNQRGQYLGRVIFRKVGAGAESADDRIRAETERTLRTDASLMRDNLRMGDALTAAHTDVEALRALVAGMQRRPPVQTQEAFRTAVVRTLRNMNDSMQPLNSAWKDHVVKVANGILAQVNLHIVRGDTLTLADGVVVSEGIDGTEMTAGGTLLDAYLGMLRKEVQGINDYARSARLTTEQLSRLVSGLELGTHNAARISDSAVIGIETIEGAPQVIVYSADMVRRSLREFLDAIPRLKPPQAMEAADRIGRLYRYAMLLRIVLPPAERQAGNAYVSVEAGRGFDDISVRESIAGRAYRTMLTELPGLLEIAGRGEWQTIDQLFGEDGRLKWLCYELPEEDRTVFLTQINSGLPGTTRVRFAYSPGRNTHTRELTIEENRQVDAAIEQAQTSPERTTELTTQLVSAAATPSGEAVDDTIRLLAARMPADGQELFASRINDALRQGNRVVRVRLVDGRLQRALDVPRAADMELLEDRVALPLGFVEGFLVQVNRSDALAELNRAASAAAVRPAAVSLANERLAALRSPLRVRLRGEIIEQGPDAAVPEEPLSPSVVSVAHLRAAWRLRPPTRRQFGTPLETFTFGSAMFTRNFERVLRIAQAELDAIPPALRQTHIDALNRALRGTALRFQLNGNRLERAADDPATEDRPNAGFEDVPNPADVPAGVFGGAPGEKNDRVRANIDLQGLAAQLVENRWGRVGETTGSTFYFYAGASMPTAISLTLFRAVRDGERIRYSRLRNDSNNPAENYEWENITELPGRIGALPDDRR